MPGTPSRWHLARGRHTGARGLTGTRPSHDEALSREIAALLSAKLFAACVDAAFCEFTTRKALAATASPWLNGRFEVDGFRADVDVLVVRAQCIKIFGYIPQPDPADLELRRLAFQWAVLSRLGKRVEAAAGIPLGAKQSLQSWDGQGIDLTHRVEALLKATRVDMEKLIAF